MTDELFSTPETLSPRLAWMNKYAIKTRQDSAERWTAWRSLWSHFPTPLNSASANTEENALFELAVKCGIRLWNEE